MKLDFGILWFEDNPFPIERSNLEKAIRNVGFRPYIEIKEDGSEIESLAELQLQDHTFDLVLIDLSLANDESGDKLAERVRELFSFTPILFYSGNEEIDELKKRIADLRIEGVFCSDRDNYGAKAIELIKNFAPSLERLTGMRGLAAQVVTEIDMEFQKIIREIANEIDEEIAIEIIDTQIEKTEEYSKKVKNSFTNLESRLTKSIVGSRVLFESARKFLEHKIKNTQDNEKKNELQNLLKSIKRYDPDVLQIRNKLTHNKESDEERERSNFAEYRLNFIRYLDNIAKISKILSRDQ